MKISCGLLMFRRTPDLEVFLVHPGGPYFANKDQGVWTIPKGEPDVEEEYEHAATREFQEETGLKVTTRNLICIGTVRQKGGKMVYAWAFETFITEDLQLESNTFQMEWPPRSGNIVTFPEVDQWGFFTVPIALKKINEAQRQFIFRLTEYLSHQNMMPKT